MDSRFGFVQLVTKSKEISIEGFQENIFYSVDETKMFIEGVGTKATLNFNGLVQWKPPALVKTICPIKVQWYFI